MSDWLQLLLEMPCCLLVLANGRGCSSSDTNLGGGGGDDGGDDDDDDDDDCLFT